MCTPIPLVRANAIDDLMEDDALQVMELTDVQAVDSLAEEPMRDVGLGEKSRLVTIVWAILLCKFEIAVWLDCGRQYDMNSVVVNVKAPVVNNIRTDAECPSDLLHTIEELDVHAVFSQEVDPNPALALCGVPVILVAIDTYCFEEGSRGKLR